ncbi:YopX family protein [Staphylococcus epidermidis]|uniref:YopX family protein n=1 Tax=Staphylococcus epidermidis TaxID=1282 RepID=UPI001FB1DD71|nr:YopX family protein [Staphylococcus epidermidis]MCJ1767968.1 YopX family protein [Staphylococcus epidermidis]
MIPKFREWDAVREEIFPGKGMSYGVREDFDDSFKITFSHMEDLDIINDDGSINRVVMMSTGLKDKNGIEIYEGDIVQHSEKPNPCFSYPFKVIQARTGEWRLDNFRCGTVLAFSNQDELEVLGNIYENPELLEDE